MSATNVWTQEGVHEETTHKALDPQVAGGDEKISISSLSELTGFPVEFIKKELLLDQEPISMNDLRQSMIAYLEQSNQMMMEFMDE